MKRTFIFGIILVLTAALIQSSCTKIDTTEIGNELIPPIDTIASFDTILDIATSNNVFVDTALSIYGQPHALGIIENDAEFGRTEAKTYISFAPTVYKSYPFGDPSKVIVDSIILSLAYNSAYGDSTSIEQIEVREIDLSSNFTDTTYRLSDPDFAVNAAVLGSMVVDFNRLSHDSVKYVDVKDTITAKELRISLDTSFARRFIDYDTATAYAKDANFKSVFKGLQISVNDGASTKKKALAYFTLTDEEHTKITFYCRIQKNGVADTIAAKFIHTEGADAQANLIRRTPQNGYLAYTSNNIANEDKLYIQSTPGSYSDITIPGLTSFPNSVIHRAELIFEKYPSQEDFYRPPAALYLEALSGEKDSAFTLRNVFVQSSSYPYYDITNMGGGLRDDSYNFNISRYVQSIVTHQYPNYALRLQAPYWLMTYYMPANSNVIPSATNNKTPVFLDVPVAAGRVVLYGGADVSPKRARLHIIYSRIR